MAGASMDASSQARSRFSEKAWDMRLTVEDQRQLSDAVALRADAGSAFAGHSGLWR
jgi:hypothetical protein